MKSMDPLPGSACLHAREGGHIWRVRDRQNVRLLPFQPLAGLDPQVQLQFTVDPA
jgi:hypothetical protein